MIPSERSPMQEILTNSVYRYDISTEFSNWMKYKHYPIVSGTPRNQFSYGKLLQNFGTNHGKWWIPIRLIFQNIFWTLYVLSSQNPIADIIYEGDWVMIDIRQAGKYVSKLFIFIFM